MRTAVFSFTLMSVLAVLAMPHAAAAETIEFEGRTWTTGETDGSEIRLETFKGRPALYLGRNFISLPDVDLADVVIEYDYASTHASGFIGTRFRENSDTRSREQFYTRPHQSGQPDATQHMGAINGVGTWQLHAGPNDAVAYDFTPQEWTKIRIVALGDRADIFVGDMAKPLIHVPDLRHDGGRGAVSLYASDRRWRKDTGAYFSNITVRAANASDKIIGVPAKTDPLPEGLISAFDVSAPVAESLLETVFDLKDLTAAPSEWQRLEAESDGVVNLARRTRLTREKNTVFVRFRVRSKQDTQRLMRFGYSDRVRLYVDGALVYAGNAGWRSRDHRFLGTVGLEDQVALSLPKGETEIIAVVSESFGGWGFTAAIDNQSGIVIRP